MSSYQIGLRKLFFEQVAGFIGQYGFKRRRNDPTFVRSQPNGSDVFHLALVPHENVDTDINPHIGIRIDAVEDLVNQCRADLSDITKKRTATIGCDLGKLIDGKQKTWTLASESDIPAITSAIQTSLETLALPFYARYSDLDSLFQSLSSKNPEDWVSPIKSHRYYRAIALAFILKRYEKMEEIINDAEVFLSQGNDTALEDFRVFVEMMQPNK